MSDNPDDDAKLTARQEKFVKAYVAYGNATKAGLEAGYGQKSAHVTANKMLKNPKIIAAIEQERKPIFNRYEVTAERIVQELARVGFTSMGDLMEVDANGNPDLKLKDLTDEQKTAISEFQTETYAKGDDASVTKVKVKLHDKLKALEMLGRQLGMFGGKQEDDANSARAEVLRMVMAAQGTALPIGGKKK